MSKTKEQILTDLDANIPRSAISSRQGGGTKALSYLEGWYVIDRLNKIFGPDAWSYDVTELRCTHEGIITSIDAYTKKEKQTHHVSYVATVALYVQFPDGESAKRITDVGFGNGTDKTDPGKPHELATKEAVTDALKRCAKSLGMSLGLALYDKKQENVGDEAPQSNAPAAVSNVPVQGRGPVDTGLATPQSTREALNKRITAMSNVILAKAGPAGSEPRKAKLAELKADMKSKYGADSTAGLGDVEAKDLLNNLEKLANGT